MDEWRVLVALGNAGIDVPLRRRVGEEVNGSGGRHTDQIGTQATKKAARTLRRNDMPKKIML